MIIRIVNRGKKLVKLRVVLRLPIEILGSFFLMIATYLPGLLGNILRQLYYKKKLKYMGDSCRIYQGAVIMHPQNVLIGDYTLIDRNVIISGDVGVKIGRRVHIAHNCLIQGGGFVEIGDYVGIGANSMIFSATDTIYGGKRVGPMISAEYRNPVFKKPVIIEKDVFIGAGCVILPGVKIQEGAVVGAGSLVIKDIPPWKVAVGSPAKPVKDRPKINLPDF